MTGWGIAVLRETPDFACLVILHVPGQHPDEGKVSKSLILGERFKGAPETSVIKANYYFNAI